jgi:dimeric dUTPase (all-alpha-NTP-PPase superfamily)
MCRWGKRPTIYYSSTIEFLIVGIAEDYSNGLSLLVSLSLMKNLQKTQSMKPNNSTTISV